MEPITLITAALGFATPYLIKSGEKIAEDIGEEIWKIIKKPFSKEKQPRLANDLIDKSGREKIVEELLEKVKVDADYKLELEAAVKVAREKLETYNQKISNFGNIDKQVNIQNLKGNITF